MSGEACVVCGSSHGLQEHHLVQQASGGTRGPTRWVCSTCHTCAHQTARARNSRNPEVRAKNYFPPESRERAEPLVQALVLGDRWAAEHASELQDERSGTISIKVSPRQRARLHKLKADHGYRSLDAMMSDVIERMTRTKEGL